jgi:hypothetical protein
VELGVELLSRVESSMMTKVPLAKPVFLVTAVKMSKRYLKGGLQSNFSFMVGLSIKELNMSAVGFQKSPIALSKIL